MYCFEQFELDTDKQELRLRDQVVAIEPKTLSVLTYLIEHNDRMVTKRELMEAFWSRNASETALQKTISRARKALGDEDADRPLLKTYHGRGFRFMPALSSIKMAPEPDTQTQSGHAIREQRQVAVLCVNLSFFDVDAAEAGQGVVDAFLEAARLMVADNQGKLLHMMVSGFTASFGLDPEYEDSARRAAHCAWALARSAESVALAADGAQVAFSIDVGAVMLVEDADGSEWQPPSAIELRSSALAETATQSGILITAATQQLLRDEAEVTPVDSAFHLTSFISNSTGIPARPSKHPTPFVGREAELAFLNSCLEQTKAGQFQAATLSGPPGIGKSRLTVEFLSSLEPDKLQYCKIHCLPRLQNSVLAPLRQMCAALLAREPHDIAQGPIDAALLRLLLDVDAPPDPILDGLSDRKRRQSISALIGQILRCASAEIPLVLVFEDVHWIDATSRGTLDALVRAGGIENVFLLVTTRPIDSTPIAESTLHLSPLRPDDSLRLVREMPTVIDDKHAMALVHRADGNPFFLEELVLVAQSGADPRAELPETVQAVIAVRIGELSSSLRTLLYVLAIIGDKYSLDLIVYLTQRDGIDVESDLLLLTRRGFLIEETSGFSFRHMLLSDTAYSMVAKTDRQQLHLKIAEYLEEADPTVHSETLAWHYQEAGHRDQAISYWTKATYGALHRSARPEAIVFAQSGLALIDPADNGQAEQELRLRLALATALMAVRGYGAKEVGEELDRALLLGKHAGSFKTKVRVLMGLWVHTWVTGQLSTSLEHATTLLGMAALVKDPSLDLQAHTGAGAVLTHKGQLSKAIFHLEKGLQHAQETALQNITSQNAAVTCAAYAAWVSGMQGRRSDLIAHCDRSRTLSEVRENPFARAIYLGLCTNAHMFAGDLTTTLELATQTVRLSREHGFPFWLGTGLVMQGWCLGQKGEFEQAIEMIDEGIVVFQATGAIVQFTKQYGLKAEIHLRAGQIEMGLAAADRAMKHAKRTDEVWFTPRVHAVMSGLYAKMGNEAKMQEHS